MEAVPKTEVLEQPQYIVCYTEKLLNKSFLIKPGSPYPAPRSFGLNKNAPVNAAVFRP
jgi:hypothetical protein